MQKTKSDKEILAEVYRNAQLREGWPMRAIPREAARPGDALYFPGHIALYLGEGLYIHSTAASGGVVVNSLDPASPLYRADLDEKMTCAGTLFSQGETTHESL